MSGQNLDVELKRLVDAHRATASYTVYRSETTPVRRKVDLAKDLHWDQAKALAESLDLESEAAYPTQSSWMRPLHFPQLLQNS